MPDEHQPYGRPADTTPTSAPPLPGHSRHAHDAATPVTSSQAGTNPASGSTDVAAQQAGTPSTTAAPANDIPHTIHSSANLRPQYVPPQPRQLREAPPEDDEPASAPGHRYDHILPPAKKRHGKQVFLAILILVVLGVGGYVAYNLISNKKEPAKTTPASAATDQPATAPVSDSTPVDKKSDPLGIQITARKDWAIQEDSTSGALTVTSPKVTYTLKDGTSRQGNFVLTFQKGADDSSVQTIHATAAAQDSETIAYTQPTENQRYYTNVTIGGNGGPDAASFLAVTGSTQFKKGDSLSNYFINGDTYVIIGGFHSTGKTSLTTYDNLSLDGFTGSDTYNQAITIIKSLKIF